MTISGIETTGAINISNLQDSNKCNCVKGAVVKQLADEFSESDETSKFKEIAGKYDITNISRNETNKMFRELMDNGLISFKELALATFDPTHIPGWKDEVSSVSGWKVSSNPDEKMNFLEGFRIQAEFNKMYGNPDFQQNYDKRVELAEKIKYFQS